MSKVVVFVAWSFLLAGSQQLVAQADDPSTARDFYQRGQLRERENRYDEALADYSKAVELDPLFVSAYFSRSSLYAGRPQLDKREYAKAVADLSSILAIDPTDFSARFNRALAYESLGEYDQAIADYTRVIEGETDFTRTVEGDDASLAHTYHYRGRAYQWYKHDNARAAADYSEALRLDPESEMVHYRRGQAYNSLKEYAKAAADFAVALERDPEYPNLLCAYAWQLATCPESEYRDGTTALELAKKANQKLRWEVQDQVETLAAAYAESGEFDEAIKWQKKAIELFFKAKVHPEYHKVLQDRLELYQAGKPYRAE